MRRVGSAALIVRGALSIERRELAAIAYDPTSGSAVEVVVTLGAWLERLRVVDSTWADAISALVAEWKEESADTREMTEFLAEFVEVVTVVDTPELSVTIPEKIPAKLKSAPPDAGKESSKKTAGSAKGSSRKRGENRSVATARLADVDGEEGAPRSPKHRSSRDAGSSSPPSPHARDAGGGFRRPMPQAREPTVVVRDEACDAAPRGAEGPGSTGTLP